MDRLSGIIRAYDWGDLEALPEILGIEATGQPQAEYWLGAHPSGPAVLATSGHPLDRAIEADPEGLLGPEVAERFGQLPFLLKILAARQALSIQAHPSVEQAVAGFDREDAAGVGRDAPNRIYRDPNHKPELICALTRFEARCGFRDPAVTDGVLERFGPALRPVRDRLAADDPADVALWLLGLPPGAAATLARGAVDGAEAAAGGHDAALAAELESTVEVGRAFPGDIGVVVALLLNHVVLEAGQALFLGAGNVHAYLRGVGVEAMATSDNVIRGGLTAKHIDVDELAAIIDPSWGPVPVQTPTGPVHGYDVPVADFAMTRIAGESESIGTIDVDPTGPEIILVTAGAVGLESCSPPLQLVAGQAAFIAPGDGPYRLDPNERGAVSAWRVAVGEGS